jgi:PAS domain S-box-containing protein
VKARDFDVAISETNSFGYPDLHVLHMVKQQAPEIPVLIYSRNTSVEIAVKSIKMGAADYIIKSPDHLPNLVSALFNIQSVPTTGSDRELPNDISTNKRIAEQLRKLSLAVHQNPVSIVITDADGNIEYVNPKFSKLTGYEPHEVIGKNPRLLKSGNTSDEDYKVLWKTIKSGNEWRGEFQNCKKNGEIYTESASISPIADENGIITHFVATKEDITEKKHAEKLIKTLSRAIEQSPASIIITNDKGKIDFVNTKFTSFMQYTEQEVIGRNPRIFNPHHLPGTEYEQMWETLHSGKLWQGENQNRKKDGTLFWENVSISPLMDENGTISNYILIMEDISEKKKMLDDLIIAKEKAEESEEIFNQFMKHSPIYVFFKDDKIRPVRLSNNYEKMLELPMNELLGKTMFDLFPSELAKKMEEDDLRILSENQVFEVEEEFNDKYYTTIKFPIHMNGKPRFLAGFTLDISERKQSELMLKEKNEQLIKAIEKAKESDRLKTAFLANMSHEIRTPMNGILGFTELLKTPDLSGIKQQEFIYLIRKSGERMLNIINNIIDISKIESGQMEVSFSTTDINEQIEYLHSFFKTETDQRGLKISTTVTLSPALAKIKTDKEKVYAILTNLVKNAVKFTPAGSIRFGYELKNDTLEFFVQDTGVGIPQEQQEFIFERFRQGNESLARKHEGAGLGLSITKAYVEMLGGKIWVESESGKGSAFYFTIPYLVDSEEIKRPKTAVSAQTDKGPYQKLKILIAEDDEFSAMLITKAIQPFCKELFVAGNGAEAVEELHRYPDIDLVLMDISMPVMDGYEATKKIRYFNKNVIIIAQTAYGLMGDKEKALAAGCNDHISKPIRNKDLYGLIQKHFDGTVTAEN